MRSTEPELSAFAAGHLDEAVALSRAAGWPHRREDWALVLSLSVGQVALDAGRVVGTAMMTPFGGTATINMVIVDEAMRGRGLGRRLMEAALAAAAGRDCRLVATRDGLPLYEKLGFRSVGEILQHQGHAAADTDGTAEGIAWEAPPAADLAVLDRAACGMEREGLLARLAAEGQVAVLRRSGAVAGFAVRRRFGRGEVIGPVVAPGPDEARALIAFAIAARPGVFLRVDTPAGTHLGPWLAERGLARAGGGIVMVRDGARPPASAATAPPSPPPRTFALASQALG
ncbi:GNAT family N-acetyltransferase [Methylobacterium sp. JK268]